MTTRPSSRALVLLLSVICAAEVASCACCKPTTLTPEQLAALCKSLVDLERAGGEKAPAHCHDLAAPRGFATFSVRGGRMRMPYVVRSGRMIAGGDIVLGNAPQGPQPLALVVASNALRWPEGRIPYEITGFDEGDVKKIEEAMRDWEAAASIRFVPKTGDDTKWVPIAKFTGADYIAGESSLGMTLPNATQVFALRAPVELDVV